MGIRTSVCNDAQLLEKYINTSFDVVKQAVENLDTIKLFGSVQADSEIVVFLQDLLDNIDGVTNIVNSTELIETISLDVQKGTFNGSRKLDIDLVLNKDGVDQSTSSIDALAIWNNTATTVYYSQATATFTDGTVIVIPFVNDDGDPITISTHGALAYQLNQNVTFTGKLLYTSITEEVGGKSGAILRITDILGTASNLHQIQLTASSGNYNSNVPIYTWIGTTSALEALATRVADIINISAYLTELIELGNNMDNYNVLYDNLTELNAIYNNLAAILDASNQAALALGYANDSSVHAANSLNSANNANSAAISAANSLAQIQDITIDEVVTLAPTEPATVTYDAINNEFDFGIPQGIQGQKGDSYPVDAEDLIANRANYESFIDYPTYTITTTVGHSFLAIDEGNIYFVVSTGPTTWSAGYPFAQGVGIAQIVFTSTTDPSGLAAQSGAVDTYTITYTDATTQTYTVYNGDDGAVASVAGKTGVVTLVTTDITDYASEKSEIISTSEDTAIAMAIALGG